MVGRAMDQSKLATLFPNMCVSSSVMVSITALLMCGGHPTFASEPSEAYLGPFVGVVRDANDDQPIPGAVFVVMWLQRHALVGHPTTTFYDARIGVTDLQGHFEIAALPAPLDDEPA